MSGEGRQEVERPGVGGGAAHAEAQDRRRHPDPRDQRKKLTGESRQTGLE